MSATTYQSITEALSQIKANQLNEDGHTDVPSSIRMCKTIMEDAYDILCALCNTDMDEEIDTWWTNKLAVSASTLNKLRDYYVHEVDHEDQALASSQAMAGKGIQEEAPLIDPEIARQVKPIGSVRVPGGFDAPVGPSAEGIFPLADQEQSLSINPNYVAAVNKANSYNNLKTGMAPRPDHKIKRDAKGLSALSDMMKGRRKIPTPGGNYVTDNFPHTGIVPSIMARRKARNAPPLTRGQTR